MKTEVIKCPKCKGKGHVLAPETIVAGPLAWIIGFAERNDRKGISRDRCDECNGGGYIRVPQTR